MVYALVIYLCLPEKCSLPNNGGIEYVSSYMSLFECNGIAGSKLSSMPDVNKGYWFGQCTSKKIIETFNIKDM